MTHTTTDAAEAAWFAQHVGPPAGQPPKRKQVKRDYSWLAPVRVPIGLFAIAAYWIVTDDPVHAARFGRTMEAIGPGWTLFAVGIVQVIDSVQAAWRARND